MWTYIFLFLIITMMMVVMKGAIDFIRYVADYIAMYRNVRRRLYS